jgi:hypothetical protein
MPLLLAVDLMLTREVVYQSSDLKWKNQAIYAANKANQILGMLKRTFTYFDVNLVKLLYFTKHLEFAIAAWFPNQKDDTSKLQNPSIQDNQWPRSCKLVLAGVVSIAADIFNWKPNSRSSVQNHRA